MTEIQTELLTAGHFTPGMHAVEFDLTGFSDRFCLLFYALNEIWLKNHCKKEWYMEISCEIGIYRRCYSQLIIKFEDAREAVFFKLSPQFELFTKRMAASNLHFVLH